MAEQNRLLIELDTLMKNSFTDAIVWEQKGMGLIGKYVYMKYDEDKIGLFIGYLLDDNSRIKACVTCIFPHPTSSMLPVEVGRGRLFYKILIRSNLKLEANPYRIVYGRKTPAIIRTLYFKDGSSHNFESSFRFFTESIGAIKRSQPICKVLV